MMTYNYNNKNIYSDEKNILIEINPFGCTTSKEKKKMV